MKHGTNWIALYVSFLVNDVVAFGVTAVVRSTIFTAGRSIRTRSLSEKKDDSSSKDSVEDAIHQLEQLMSPNNDHFSPTLERRKKLEESSSEVRELVLSIQAEELPKTKMSMGLFDDMFSEFSETTEKDMIKKLKNEMTGLPLTSTDSDASKSETEIFMEVALDQAIREAQIEAQMGIDKESLLQNQEIMEEIALIFERANAKLMEGIEEIRREQMALVVENASQNAKLSQDRIDSDQERLVAAEDNMRKMLAKVNQETKNVEAAIEDLKRAQVDLQGGLDGKLMNLKRGGLAKQATLVGAFLFSFRSIVEGLALGGGDATHLIPALLQGAIAVACFVAFILL